MYQFGDQRAGNVDVVDTPALVVVAGTTEIAPPAILVRVFIKVAEGIGKAAVGKELVQPGALLWEEA